MAGAEPRRSPTDPPVLAVARAAIRSPVGVASAGSGCSSSACWRRAACVAARRAFGSAGLHARPPSGPTQGHRPVLHGAGQPAARQEAGKGAAGTATRPRYARADRRPRSGAAGAGRQGRHPTCCPASPRTGACRCRSMPRVSTSSTRRPRVGLLLAGMGLNQTDSDAAIRSLPGGVTLAFSPYAQNVTKLLSAARAGRARIPAVDPHGTAGISAERSWPAGADDDPLAGAEPALGWNGRCRASPVMSA